MRTNQSERKTPNTQKSARRFFKPSAESISKVYVGNLSYEIDEPALHKIFKKYGKVGKINVIRDKKTSKSTGIAFIQMFNKKDSQTAIDELDGSVLEGRTLKVSIAQEREPRKKRDAKDAKLESIRSRGSKPRRKRRFDFDFSKKSD